MTMLLTINMKEETLMINDGVLDILDHPKHVQIMMNDEEKMLLVRPCDINSKHAVVLPDERTVQVETGARSLLKKIKKIAGWKTDEPRVCPGIDLPEYQAVCFDLTEAFTVDVEEDDTGDESGGRTEGETGDIKSESGGRSEVG